MLKIVSVTMSPFIRQEKAAKTVTLRSLDKVSARSLRFDETQSAADASAPYLPSDSPSGVPRAESRLERTGSSTHGMGLWGGKKKRGILIGFLSANLPEIPTVHLIRAKKV